MEESGAVVPERHGNRLQFISLHALDRCPTYGLSLGGTLPTTHPTMLTFLNQYQSTDKSSN